jgi:hypothetical protein
MMARSIDNEGAAPRLGAVQPPAFALRILMATGLVLAGCGPVKTANRAAVEAPLADQAARVRGGASDTIQLLETTLAPGELETLAGLENLQTLLLDDPTRTFSAAELQPLIELTHLRHLRIRGRGIGDEALAQCAKIESLQILNVPQGQFTDDGLALLARLPHLVQLRFGSPRVTDAGMKTIATLPALKRLHLIDVPITDAGLADLASMQQLESLYLDGAEVSDAAVDELFRKRPELHVHFNQEHHDHDPHRHPHE